jgi:hypothetical protein
MATGLGLISLGIGPLAAVPAAANPTDDVSHRRPPAASAKPHPSAQSTSTSTPSPTTTHRTSPHPTAKPTTPTPTTSSSSTSPSEPSQTSSTPPPPVQRPPSAQPDALHVSEDSGATGAAVLANDSDPDGDDLTVTAVSQPAHGAASRTASTVRYTPDANFHGTDSVTYRVSDGHGNTDTAVLTISVASVNDAPVARSDSYAVQTGGTVSGSVLGNDSDIDDDALHVSSDDSASVAVAANGHFSYTAGGAPGVITFHYVVSDGTAHDTGTVTITVSAAPVNLSSLYLRGGSTSVTGAMTTAAPTQGTTDWDADGKPGLTLRDSDLKVTDTDVKKYQTWAYTAPSGGLALNGPVSLSLWSTTKQEKKKDLDYSAWVYDCTGLNTGCTLLRSVTNVHVTRWSTTTTWEHRTVTIGSINHTVASGHRLQVRFMVHRSDLWLALDAAHPSQLLITQ